MLVLRSHVIPSKQQGWAVPDIVSLITLTYLPGDLGDKRIQLDRQIYTSIQQRPDLHG